MENLLIYSALILFFVCVATLVNVVLSRIVVSHYAPNWSSALNSLPVPKYLSKRNSWKVAYVRDSPDKMLLRYMINLNDQGILLRPYMEHVYLGKIITNYRTMFIPWTALTNPRAAMVRRTSCLSLIRSNPVELDVKGQQFSVVLATSDIKTVFVGVGSQNPDATKNESQK